MNGQVGVFLQIFIEKYKILIQKFYKQITQV